MIAKLPKLMIFFGRESSSKMNGGIYFTTFPYNCLLLQCGCQKGETQKVMSFYDPNEAIAFLLPETASNGEYS